MDTIVISNIVAPVKIGVSVEERAAPQRIRIDIELGTDFTNVIRTLDLKQGVNYACVRRLILAVVEEGEFFLLEELGHRLIRKIFDCTPWVKEISITVSKIDLWRKVIPGIRMKRERKEQ